MGGLVVVRRMSRRGRCPCAFRTPGECAERCGEGGAGRLPASVREEVWGPAAGRRVDCPEGQGRTPSRPPAPDRGAGRAGPAALGIGGTGEGRDPRGRGAGAWPGPGRWGMARAGALMARRCGPRRPGRGVAGPWVGLRGPSRSPGRSRIRGAGPGTGEVESRGLGVGSGVRLGFRSGHGPEVRAPAPARSGSCAASDRGPGPAPESGAVTDPRCGPRRRSGWGVARPRVGVPSRHGSEVRAAASARRAGEAATDAP